MDEEQDDPYVDSEDFDLDDLDDEEEASVEFESEEVDDFRDLENKKVRFQNKVLNEIDLADKHHLITYIIPDEQRMTSQIMTLEEFTEAVGIRATQIERGAPVFTDVSGYSDPIEMAKKEIFDGRCPLKLVREMKQLENARWVEVWKINDMTIPVMRRELMKPTDKEIQERLGEKVEEKKEEKPEKKVEEKKEVKKKVTRTAKKK